MRAAWLVGCVLWAAVAQADEGAATLQAWGKLEPLGGKVEVPVRVGQQASIWLSCRGCGARLVVSGVPGRIEPSSALGESEAGVEFSVYAGGTLVVSVESGLRDMKGPYALWVRLDGEQALTGPSEKVPGWVRATKLPEPGPWVAANAGAEAAPFDGPPMAETMGSGWSCGGVGEAAAFVVGQNPQGLESLRAAETDPAPWMLVEGVFVPSCQAARRGQELSVLCASEPNLSVIDGRALYRMLELKLDECLESWLPAVLPPTVGSGYNRELGKLWSLHGVEVRALLEVGVSKEERLVRLLVQRAKAGQ
jgi:hypothetical protein